jgi:hypothetical protein
MIFLQDVMFVMADLCIFRRCFMYLLHPSQLQIQDAGIPDPTKGTSAARHVGDVHLI